MPRKGGERESILTGKLVGRKESAEFTRGKKGDQLSTQSTGKVIGWGGTCVFLNKKEKDCSQQMQKRGKALENTMGRESNRW